MGTPSAYVRRAVARCPVSYPRTRSVALRSGCCNVRPVDPVFFDQACLAGRHRRSGGSVDFPQIAQYFVPEGEGHGLKRARGKNLLAETTGTIQLRQERVLSREARVKT